MTNKELISRLREKVSRDNRELLDAAADAIEALDHKPCEYCATGGLLLDEGVIRVHLLLSPTPHLLMRMDGKAVGVAINACPICGRRLEEKR